MHLTQLEAYGLTLAVESVAAITLAPAFKIARSAAAFSAVAGSTLTHPQLWLWFNDVYDAIGNLTTPSLEAVVIVIEAPFYRYITGARWSEALLLSLLINAASWWAGEIMHAL